ncbi:vegetative incompatibility protein HET-E-1 [Podospora australis]|uniref:Vegetative incompatibility protein HET-E-1 n=1 Tax=Podospora australis TaxID=1536484 RepID=A0AAN7AJJ6_9PEZI|nr:vegetative incompatibility protein HET-E-1 [Podospora australis]
MRLLTWNPRALSIESKYFPDSSDIPPYAILSHTWDPLSEVSFQELGNPKSFSKPGYDKIRQTASLAKTGDKDNPLEWCWVDTCCIDKTSSAELTEAINSMFKWYARAAVCYVYLYDYDSRKDPERSTLGDCLWFTRGWTLQELIAPRNVVFFDKEWREIGTKIDLSREISKITGIPEDLLRGETYVEEYSVAKRMSWASLRQTTREEDMAYCLLGLFNVNMSLLYGEGKEKAFYRLQKECIQLEADLSIFAWTSDDDTKEYAPILAKSPSQFKNCGKLSVRLENTIYRKLTMNPRGIEKIVSWIHYPDHEDDAYRCILDIFCTEDGTNQPAGVSVRKIAGGVYARYKPWMLVKVSEDSLVRRPWRDTNRMLVEGVTLATSFPERFPFGMRENRNPVTGNRHCALRVNIESDGDGILKGHHYRVLPRSHWDVHDRVAFCSAQHSKSWAAFFVRGVACVTKDFCVPVSFFLGCTRWNVGRPQIILASLHGLDRQKTINLEAKLHSLLFENSREALATMTGYLDGRAGIDDYNDGKTERAVITVLESQVVARDLIQGQVSTDEENGDEAGWGPGIVTFGGEFGANFYDPWHSKLPTDIGEHKKVRIQVAVELKKEEDPTICFAPIFRLDVRLSFVGERPAFRHML